MIVAQEASPPRQLGLVYPAIVALTRRFVLRRDHDVSGVSGEGLVAVGVVFPSGKVELEWLSEIPSHGSYDDLHEVTRIAGHGGATVIEWIDTG